MNILPNLTTVLEILAPCQKPTIYQKKLKLPPPSHPREEFPLSFVLSIDSCRTK